MDVELTGCLCQRAIHVLFWTFIKYHFLGRWRYTCLLSKGFLKRTKHRIAICSSELAVYVCFDVCGRVARSKSDKSDTTPGITRGNFQFITITPEPTVRCILRNCSVSLSSPVLNSALPSTPDPTSSLSLDLANIMYLADWHNPDRYTSSRWPVRHGSPRGPTIRETRPQFQIFESSIISENKRRQIHLALGKRNKTLSNIKMAQFSSTGQGGRVVKAQD